MNTRVITPPSVEPVTLAEVKLALSIDGTDRDTQLTSAITAARMLVEEHTGNALITQTLEGGMSAFSKEFVELPGTPLQSITSVESYAADGTQATISTSLYSVDVIGRPGGFKLTTDASWPSTTLRSVNGVVVTYIAGYGDAASDVPRPLQDAIIETVRALIDSDTDWMGRLPALARALCKPYRVRPI